MVCTDCLNTKPQGVSGKACKAMWIFVVVMLWNL